MSEKWDKWPVQDAWDGGGGGSPPAPSTYDISGAITGDEDTGVTVTLSGDADDTFETEAGGAFSFADLPSGDYVLTPTLAGYTFAPESINVSIVAADQTDQDFASTLITYTISGTITGTVVEGVTITLSGDADDSTTTAVDGTYSFTGLADGSYTVTPTLTDKSFTPDHRDTSVSGDDVVVDDFVYEDFPYIAAWNDGVVPGSDITIYSPNGASVTPSSVVTPQSADYAHTPSRTPSLRVLAPHNSAGYNTVNSLITPSAALDLSAGVRIEAVVYGGENQTTIRWWVQFIDKDDASLPYIGFYVDFGAADILRIAERRSSSTSLIYDGTQGWTAPDSTNAWVKLRMQLPPNLSGNVLASVDLLGTGGSSGTQRSGALTQNWSAFVTGKIVIGRAITSNYNIDSYFNYIWVGTASDDWPT